jgi:hypothetical protein
LEEVRKVLTIIYGLVAWVIVPIVILAILALAIRIISSVSDSDNEVSAKAGFWAGLLLFVVYVVSQLATLENITFTSDYFNYMPQFNILTTVIGSVIGFASLAGMSYLIPTRVVGLVTLLLTCASTSALFNYIFIENDRNLVMCFAVGTLVGALIYMVVFPTPFREIWR